MKISQTYHHHHHCETYLLRLSSIGRQRKTQTILVGSLGQVRASFLLPLSIHVVYEVFLQQLNTLYLLVNLVVHEPPPPPLDVDTSVVLLVPLLIIHLPRQDLGPDGARQVSVRTARVRICIPMGVPTPEAVED